MPAPAEEVEMGLLENVHGRGLHHQHQILSAATCWRRDSTSSNSVFDTKIDVNRFEISPMNSVIAKPRIGPVPNWNRNAHEMSAATCVSTSVQKTRLKPALIEARTPRCDSSSSLMRSKISTFESTPMPIVSTKPAMPGSVITAPT